jgi:hypothetical protein
VARFSPNILTKKSFTKLFGVTEQKGKPIHTYLKRFNEEMLKVEKFIESVNIEALIRKVKEHALLRKLYTLPDKSLLKVKQIMKNHIRVENVCVLRYGPPHFYNASQHKGSSKQNHYSSINESSRKKHEGLTYRRLVL